MVIVVTPGPGSFSRSDRRVVEAGADDVVAAACMRVDAVRQQDEDELSHRVDPERSAGKAGVAEAAR